MANQDKLNGSDTLQEIQSQADAWGAVFGRVHDQLDRVRTHYLDADEIVFTGCGSAFNVAHSLAAQCQGMTGKTSRAVHASQLMIQPHTILNKTRRTLVVAYSRSGDTTETSLAVETAQKAGAATIAVVCFPQSRMAQAADVTIVLEEAVEQSVVTTRSVTAMVICGYYMAAACANEDRVCQALTTLPDIARTRMPRFQELGHTLGEDVELTKFAFLGSGSYFGLAREAQLKVKETTLLPSDAYVSLDFQHGPKSTVDEHMLLTIMVSDAGRHYDLQLARNMKGLGGRILVLCDGSDGGFAAYADHLIELKTGLGDGVRDVLYLPVIQFLAYYRALHLGQNPDAPKNLSYFVTVEPHS